MKVLELSSTSSSPAPTIRDRIERTVLEGAITAAVRKSGAPCESFVGIIVEQVNRNSSSETNWAIKGVKFGRSDREECSSALSVIVERLKREFEMAD
jgi:hypothetical protein